MQAQHCGLFQTIVYRIMGEGEEQKDFSYIGI